LNRDALRQHWLLDPEIRFLNHGSFGACPRPVLDTQQGLRERIERQPVRFMVREFEAETDRALDRLGTFVGAPAQDLAFVPNATTAVNAVVRSLNLASGDELLTTNHGYNACRNVLQFAAERSGARVTIAEVPFPLANSADVLAAVFGQVTSRTRLALLDHITSPTGLILPIAELVAALRERGIDTLVDGAHGPGMVDLDLQRIGAAYYTGNLHKWVCAPKGAAFLHVRRDRQDGIRPSVISHGANAQLTDRSRFRVEFDWCGTVDPTAYLSVPAAIDFIASLVPGGWPEVRRRNRALALAGRDLLCQSLDIPTPAPDEMIGTLAAVPLPAGCGPPPLNALYIDPLQDALLEQHRIEVPVPPWPAAPHRLLRISAHVYNDLAEYRALANAVPQLLAAERS